MTFATVVVCAIFVVVVALVALAALLLHRLAPARAPHGQRVTVHTKQPDDQTIHGFLVHEYRDRLILQLAAYVTEEGDVPIAGVVRIPADSVSWIQEHE